MTIGTHETSMEYMGCLARVVDKAVKLLEHGRIRGYLD